MDEMALRRALDGLVAEKFGETARLGAISHPGGHAGLTLGFDVLGPGGAPLGDFIIRLAPAGVRRSGNTDVYRQAPLLRALHAAGLPVPEVPFAEPDEARFGAPFIVMRRLPGRPFAVWDPDPSFSRRPADVARRWFQAAELLARVHLVDWQTVLAGWEAPQPVEEDVHRWEPIMARSPEPSWLEVGEQVRDLLLAAPPPPSPVGLMHGDFQPGNILYDGDRVSGLIDWELSGIGAQLIDTGWFLMFADPKSWADGWRAVSPPPVDELQDVYETARGERFPQMPWYRASAGFRLGAITCLNVKLHRRGQRHDPTWEKFALAAPNLFGRARELLLDYGVRA